MATSERHLLVYSPALTPTPSRPPSPPAQTNFGCFSFGTTSHQYLKPPVRSSSSFTFNSQVSLPSSQRGAETVPELPLIDLSLGSETPGTPRFFHPRSISAAASAAVPNEFTTSAADVAIEDETTKMQARFDLPDLGEKDAVTLGAKASYARQASRQEGFSGVFSMSRKGSLKEDPGITRVVYINDPDRTSSGKNKRGITGNSVSTSKYTVLSFVPKNLFEQFQRVAYIYFLIIVVLNQIPPLAVFGRTASIFPLAFVLIATAVKDAYEDWGRHRSDRTENNRKSLVLQGGFYQPKKWLDIRVGEMIKIHANEIVPSDIVLLGSSEESGVAYVETMNLDGESNLKTRYAKQETSRLSPEDGSISGALICEIPNRNIYEFQAYLDMNGVHIPLGPNNVLLRGCELKNTSWIIGVVVYAGKQTKAMLNSSGVHHKRSRLERLMNHATGYLVLFLLTLCTAAGIGMGIWLKEQKDYLNELPFYRKKNYDEDKDYNYYGILGEAVVAFLSCIIVFQVMVPIALYISLELVRLWQAHFMARDVEMYHDASNSRFQCRALNINEDLGQVKYIFSDKTGTLTENKMEFHSASVGGVDYSNAQAMEGSASRTEFIISHNDNAVILGNQKWKPKVGAKVDAKLLEILQSPTNTPESRAAHEYMLVLAACNTIVPTRVYLASNGQVEMKAVANDDGSGRIEYQGESPDEQALVLAAASYGYELLERSSDSILISVMGIPQRYHILGMHQFDSVRKRMSVLIRCPDGTMKVLVKGADDSMLNVVARGGRDDESDFLEEKHLNEVTVSLLNKYSGKGLRTLLVASREIDSKQYHNWHSHYEEASIALNDRGGLLREASKLVEMDLVLLGATAIEDRLQEGVPETIALLRDAGIKVWVLTGDKQETAISIGYSCHLLTEDMQQIIIRESTKDGVLQSLRGAKKLYNIVDAEQRKGLVERDGNMSVNNKHVEKSKASTEESADVNGFLSTSDLLPSSGDLAGSGVPSTMTSQQLALIIDGNSLVHALQQDVEEELYHVARACSVVICCRVAPLQKAAVVNLIKQKTGELTLAIGDGANDVSMIQMADVGIGLSGQEGRQAVMASDFSMAQFRFLKRLLLVHGHWNYQRLSYMILYNFYRNAVFVFTLFWLILYTAYSPQSAITDWSLVFYSLIYTSIPTIVIGTLDKNLSHRTLYKYPALYGFGQRGDGYNQSLFWITMLDTVWQSLVLFYVPFLSYQLSDVDLYGLGSIWTFGVVLLVNLHLAMDVYQWNWLSHASIWGSILVTFVCMLILDSVTFDPSFLINYGSMKHILGDAKFYISILIILPVALLPRFCLKVMRQRFRPSDIQIAREAEIKGTVSNGHHRYVSAVELNNMPPS